MSKTRMLAAIVRKLALLLNGYKVGQNDLSKRGQLFTIHGSTHLKILATCLICVQVNGPKDD